MNRFIWNIYVNIISVEKNLYLQEHAITEKKQKKKKNVGYIRFIVVCSQYESYVHFPHVGFPLWQKGKCSVISCLIIIASQLLYPT